MERAENRKLPWNVQKIEQRIGRCQRIGQDNDVYVLNFLNRENYADVRFYELVFKRTTMFDGILGASDGVISDVVSGKIEETMAKGFAAVRSKEEIEKEFDDIRAEYDKEVTERKNSRMNCCSTPSPARSSKRQRTTPIY